MRPALIFYFVKLNIVFMLQFSDLSDLGQDQPRTQALWFVYVRTWDGNAREKNGKFVGKRLVEFAFKMAGQCSASVLYYLYYY